MADASEAARDKAGGVFTALGQMVTRAVRIAGYSIIITTSGLGHATRAWVRRRQVLNQMLICGVYSIPVAMLVAAFTGMVLVLQVGHLLENWSLQHQIGSVVAASLCRELGPIWVGVILAARVGSAMAAELGTMRVSEEIDALEVMSIDPADFLVMPRLIALALVAPVLTVYANLVGILGGAVVAYYQIGVSYHTYFEWARRTLTNRDMLGGVLIKAPVFGLLIAAVGCAMGLSVKPSDGAEGVGQATRKSVVIALVFLLIFNYLLTTFIRQM